MARYELIEGSSKKFWEITLDGSALTTRWGRIGTSGQSKTKSCASDAAAQKEHDALVREKLSKGYSLVGDAAVPAAPAPVRTDLSIYNEATAFIVTSASMVGRQFGPGDPAWAQAIASGDLLPFELVQDDPFIIRVVAGDELNADERDECIGSLTSKLRVPDGKLLVAGGIELVMEPAGSEVAEYLTQYARQVDVPPGDYTATLLAYVTGVNGENLLDRARGPKGEGVGAWHRRTRGSELPSWVRIWCQADPREDKGHEDDWAAPPSKRERDEQESTEYVHFLLHLTPDDGASRPQPPLEEDFFSFDAYHVRLPELCPAGILAKIPKPPKARKAKESKPSIQTMDVFARVRNRARSPIAGGPVEHPIAALADVFRLAWLATDAADPEIRIDLPADSGFVPAWPEMENVAVTSSGNEVRLGFAGGGKFAHLEAMAVVAPHLATLPEGSIVELMTSPGSYFWDVDEEDDEEVEQHPDAGVHRYRGAVRNGTWHIDDAFPSLEAATVRDALALSASVRGGRRLALRDEAEGQRVQSRLESESFLFGSNPLVLDGGEIGLKKKDVSLLHFVAQALFRTRWDSVWPGYREDEEANAAFDAELKALSEQMGAKLAAAFSPKGDFETVLDGKVGRFDKVDLLKERPLEDNLIEEADRQLRELGFEIVGDLVCSKFPEVIVRGYARPDGDVWGAYLCGVLESSFEFVTMFEQNAGLTTTFKAGPADDPTKGLYRSRHVKLNFRMLKQLHEQHEKRKATLARKLGAAVTAPVDLEAFARAVDEGVSRQQD
jgi:predicted DNA-binding WGR domain protein